MDNRDSELDEILNQFASPKVTEMELASWRKAVRRRPKWARVAVAAGVAVGFLGGMYLPGLVSSDNDQALMNFNSEPALILRFED